jgi:hypothetical protein
MSIAPDELEERRLALEEIGFTTVAYEDQGFVAVRMKMHWLWGVRMVALIRVHREKHFDKAMGEAGHKELQRLIHLHNPSKMPRGFGVFWSLCDVVLAETADDDALRWAGDKVGKGFAWNAQTAVVTPEKVHSWPSPIWGAAYQPATKHFFEVVTSGQVTPEPSAPMAIVVGLISLWPGWLMIVFGCCGLPLIPVIALVMSEKGPIPAIEGASG